MTVSEQVALFIAQGGKVIVVKSDETGIDPFIRHCKCGCRGNWTDHTMRISEKGIY